MSEYLKEQVSEGQHVNGGADGLFISQVVSDSNSHAGGRQSGLENRVRYWKQPKPGVLIMKTAVAPQCSHRTPSEGPAGSRVSRWVQWPPGGQGAGSGLRV